MKDKTWLMVSIIMGLALIISIGYSLKLRKKIIDNTDVMVSRSIVQITASNVSIKNVLTTKGKVILQNQQNNIQNNLSDGDENNNNSDIKSFLISINLNEDTIKKVKVGQKVEIKIKNEDKNFDYKGKITKIEQDEGNNKKRAIIEFNFNENVKENMEAECTIIIEEAKDVIALPLKAVKSRKNEGSTQNIINNNINITNEQNSINTTDNQSQQQKYVIIVNDDGTTSEVEVQTGISDDSYIEIVAGLSEGQKVQIEEE